MGDGVNYLYEPEGTELHWGGLEAAKKPQPQMASLSSHGGVSGVHPSDLQGMMGTSAAHAEPKPQAAPVQHAQPQQRLQSPDELMAMAHQMLDSQAAQPQGSSISPRDASGSQVTDANGQKLPDWLVRQQEGQ